MITLDDLRLAREAYMDADEDLRTVCERLTSMGKNSALGHPEYLAARRIHDYAYSRYSEALIAYNESLKLYGDA